MSDNIIANDHMLETVTDEVICKKIKFNFFGLFLKFGIINIKFNFFNYIIYLFISNLFIFKLHFLYQLFELTALFNISQTKNVTK